MTATEDPAAPNQPTAPHECQALEVLNRVGDKWSVFVIAHLADGPQRFGELRRSIEGISQRMLTVTLRGLERDGLVTRTMYPVIPPRVDYDLTPLGHSLLTTVTALIGWSQDHTGDIQHAREDYDRNNGTPAPHDTHHAPAETST